MKKFTKFIPLIIIIFTLVSACYLGGCGDDIVGPQGPQGPVGEQGEEGSAGEEGDTQVAITVDLWEGAAGGTRISDAFRVTVIRNFVADETEAAFIVSVDSTGEGTATIDGLIPGASYSITAFVFGHPPKTLQADINNDGTAQTLNFENLGSRGDFAFVSYYEELHLLDISSGTAHFVGDFRVPEPVGDWGVYYSFRAMAIHPATDVLYGTYGETGANRFLCQIDPYNAQLINIGNITGTGIGDGNIKGMSFDGNGNLYALFKSYNSPYYGSLLTIDPNTGDAVNVGSYGENYSGNGISFASDGRLFHAGNYTLGILDLNNGARTTLGNTNFDRYIRGLDINPAGTM